MQNLKAQQHPVPAELVAPLNEWTGTMSDADGIRRQFDADGYILFRDVLDKDQVLAAREEVFRRLEEVGEILPPAINGIATGQSNRAELFDDLHAFWRGVNEGTALRRVTHGERLREIMTAIFGEPARPHDLMYLRPTPGGRSTQLHFDFPFFARRSFRFCTAWIPFGDVPLTDGPLMIVEGSNQFTDMIEPIRNHDYRSEYANDVIQKIAYNEANEMDAISFARKRGAHLLTTGFHAGDLIVFGGFTLHGSFDNQSPIGRVRLSCDVRFQPAADPYDDERYFGPDPKGSKGGGYGDMRGAKPLTEPW